MTHIMLSFALGGLLGDVFFHTLPHMSTEKDEQAAMHLNFYIVAGIWVFFILEKIIHFYFSGGHSHVHEQENHSV
jgi:hypothetical protein